MPIFSRFWVHPTSSQSDPDQLERAGPALHVEVSVPGRLAVFLSQHGLPILRPQSGLALLDTGASVTAVDTAVLESLGVAPVGTATVLTPSGTQQQYLYPCRRSFPGTPMPALQFNEVTGSQLAPQGITVLIGRDLLRHFQLIYNGVDGFWTLAF